MLGRLPESKAEPMSKLVDRRGHTKLQQGVKYLEVGIGGNLVYGMFDTGANVTIIS